MNISNILNRNTREDDQRVILGQEWEKINEERKDALFYGGNQFMPDVHDVKTAKAAFNNLFFTQEKIEDHMNCLAFLKKERESDKKSPIANFQKADQVVSDSIKTALDEFYTKEEANDLKYSSHSKDKTSVTRIRTTKELDVLEVFKNKRKQSQNLNSDMFEHIPGTIDLMNEALMIVQLSTLPKTNTEEMPKESRRDFWRLKQNFLSIYDEFEECSMILTSLNRDLAEKNKFGTHVEDYDGSEKNNNHEHTEFLVHKRIKQNKSKPLYSSFSRRPVTLSIKKLHAAFNELSKLPTVTFVPNFDVLLPEQRILRQKIPSLSEYFERLHSFVLGENNRNKNWNNDKIVWPGPLVAAGFSYEGEDDIVVCKYCKCRSDTTRWTDNNENYALRMHKEGKQGRCRFLEVFGGD